MTEPVYLSDLEFHRLLEYSTSIPTGTTIGKRWKSKDPVAGDWIAGKYYGNWSMGEYYDIGSETQVGIRWTPIIVLNSSHAFELMLKKLAPWLS